MSETSSISISEAEIQQLSETIYQCYGYDFSDYSQASFKRRIIKAMMNFKIQNFAELNSRILENELFFNTFLEEITVNVTAMFRDPEFYKALRSDILPALANHPLIRIWHAGCSTGEEVYSLAILLAETGLLEKSLLYATDINQLVLERASSGKFSIDLMTEYTENYLLSGGQKELTDYYTVQFGKAVFRDELKNRMVFSPHNLVFDQSFNEFNIILCRNVLIYFNRDLQDKVIRLFADSLPESGILGLGTKESIDFSVAQECFESVNRKQRIWRKKNDK